jgi:uncharacterized repeat protein (TIGR02543 family)
VYFDKNGGDTEASPRTLKITPPQTTLGGFPQPPTKAGSTLPGWNTKADGSGSFFTPSTPVTGNITLYAQWEAIPVGPYTPPAPPAFNEFYRTVTFDCNGGEGVNPQTMRVAPPAVALGALPIPPRRLGCDFVEWNTAKDGFGSSFTKYTRVERNMTVYAKWNYISLSPYVYSVTLKANGGIGGDVVRMIPLGSGLTYEKIWWDARNESFPRHPYPAIWTFATWNTKEEGTGASYNINRESTGNITIYAKWTSARYKVTFFAYAPSAISNPVYATCDAVPPYAGAPVITVGESMPDDPTDTDPDITFREWRTVPPPYRDASWSGDPTDVGSVFTRDTPVTGDIKVYGFWDKD